MFCGCCLDQAEYKVGRLDRSEPRKRDSGEIYMKIACERKEPGMKDGRRAFPPLFKETLARSIQLDVGPWKKTEEEKKKKEPEATKRLTKRLELTN